MIGYRPARTAALALFVLGSAACDKLHHVRIDVGPDPTVASCLPPLTSEERERALAVFATVASRLGLSCRPGQYPLISGSYDEAQYRLTECNKDHTDIQLAVASGHVTVEVHKISGILEPRTFKECRAQFAEALTHAFPKGRVTVRYPH